jgi:HSP20 family protein
LETPTSSSSEKTGIRIAQLIFTTAHKNQWLSAAADDPPPPRCVRLAADKERRTIMASLVPWRRNRSQRGNLARRETFPLDRLHDEFDTMFNRVFGGLMPAGEMDEMRLWDFSMDDRDKEIVVRAELPGFEPNELDVQVQGDILTIKAEHQEKTAGQQSYNSFQRSMTLPSGVQTEGVQANYRNGVLELHLPKAPEQVGKRIPIGEHKHADQSAKAEPSKKEQKK